MKRPFDFDNNKILIVGFGVSGKAAFDALTRAGAAPAVYDMRDIASDEPDLFEKLVAAGAECFFNNAVVPDEDWGLVVLSPGVPLHLPFVERARARGAEVIGELELSCRVGSGLFAAITGTNGKTTTTTLVGEIFSRAGLKTIVCGNIGNATAAEAVGADEDTWLVTEVSSFQLETIVRFRPRIAALLNLTPDHMDRHVTMENYLAAKARIFENQEADDILVYNADDPLVVSLVRGARSRKLPFSRRAELESGAFALDGKITLAGRDTGRVPVVGADELIIPGAHNLENALAATAVAHAAGIEPGVIAEALRRFKGVEHRLEFVADIGGVRFVNDSKGTNPDAAIKAIEAVGGTENLLLIAGGYDKDAEFEDFIKSAKGKAKKLLLLGATADKIRACALAEGFDEESVVMAPGIGEAVRLGAEFASEGDTVLLSPACASWDMYGDYKERGSHFKREVMGLEGAR